MAFAVSTKFSAIDNISPFFKRAAKSSTLFGDKASKAFNKASRAGSSFGNIFKGVTAANIVSRGTAIMARGVGSVVTEFISLDDALFSASAKFKDVNLLTAEGRGIMEQLRVTARRVGGTTQFTATQAAQGLDFLALAGFDAVQSMSLLPGVTDLATVAQIDLGRATDIATDAMGAFGLKTDDVAQAQKNFLRVNDIMALTMSRTNTNIEDMFEAIKKGAPTFVAASQSVESFSALVGVLANAGIKGSEAGTQLKNVMLRLGSTANIKKLGSLGVAVADSSGNFRDILDIAADVEVALKGMGSVKRTNILDVLFGKRSVTGVSVLLREGASTIKLFRDELLNAAGVSQQMADIMRQSLGNIVKSLTSALLEKGFQILSAFQEQGTFSLKALIKGIREFDVTPLIEQLQSIAKIAKNFFKALLPVIIQLLPIGTIAIVALTTALQLLGPSLEFLIPLLVGWKLGVLAVTAAQWLMNTAMTANPIGLIIAGIGLLVVAGLWMADNWEVISGVMSGIWDVIKGGFATMVNFMVKIAMWPMRILLKGASAVAGIFGVDSDLINGALKGLDVIQAKIKDVLPSETLIGSGIVKSAIALNAPNQSEVDTRVNATIDGNINVNGLPAGSTADSTTTGFGNFNLNLGTNP